MRVLHVTEALGGGITSAILAMVEATPEVDHHLLARARSSHDTGAVLEQTFASVHHMSGNPVRALLQLRHLSRDLFPDVVHAHSSVAGVLARVAGLDRPRIVYSPHCFAFERRDIGRLQRVVFERVERALAARTDLVVGVAPNELELAARLGHRDLAYATNRTTMTSPRLAEFRTPLRIAMTGRLCRQKDWRYFLHVKRYAEAQLGLEATWTWLGGGEPEDEQALRDAGVQVSGWIAREDLIEQLGQAQVYLHTAAWEAAPISILEAASLGLPLAIRSIPPLASLQLPSLSTSISDLAERLVQVSSRDAWRQAQAESRTVVSSHSRAVQHRQLNRAYDRVCGVPSRLSRLEGPGIRRVLTPLTPDDLFDVELHLPHVARR